MKPVDDAIIHTRRLTLHPLKAAHAERMFEGLSDVASYAFTPDDPFSDVAALAARYKLLESRRSPDGAEAWLNWVIESDETRQLLGYVQFTVLPSERRALVAYFVFAPHRRQGVAFEAVWITLARVIADYALLRVDAQIDTRNSASIALVESLGFCRQHLIPHADEFKGAISDEYRYAYLPATVMA